MAYNKEYYQRNKERENAKTRADYKKHKPKRLASLREKRANRTEEQKEADRKKMRDYYHKNKERLNAYSRNRYAQTRDKLKIAEQKLAELERQEKNNDA